MLTMIYMIYMIYGIAHKVRSAQKQKDLHKTRFVSEGAFEIGCGGPFE
jgi:hypothetical protein